MKKERKTAVFYDEHEHLRAMGEGDTMSLLFKEAKKRPK